MSSKLVSAFLMLFVAITLHSECDARCTNTRMFRRAQATAVREFQTLFGNTPTLIASAVRAAFHDCIPGNTAKPGSGCNGSLRSTAELNSNGNNRLQPLVTQVTNVQGMAGCLSFADLFQIASAVAIDTAGGGNILADVVSLSNQRDDVADGVDDFVNGVLELPLSTSSFQNLLGFYQGKGFTLRDFIASVAGGHSLGRFARGFASSSNSCPLTTPGPLLDFTTDPQSITSSFASNLYDRRNGACNASGFHTLLSDDVMLTSSEAVGILGEYATDVSVLHADFRSFMIKMSALIV